MLKIMIIEDDPAIREELALLKMVSLCVPHCGRPFLRQSFLLPAGMLVRTRYGR